MARRRRRALAPPAARVDCPVAALNGDKAMKIPLREADDQSVWAGSAIVQTIQGCLEQGYASEAAKAMQGFAWPLSHQGQDACRLVQAVMREVTLSDLKHIISELRGHVLEACVCPHANFVLQCALEISPAPVMQFVSEEVGPFAMKVACHQIGCRIVIRMIEHGSGGRIPEAIAASAEGLCRHRYGSHVVRSLLEHGTPDEQEAIAIALGANDADAAIKNACHKTASYVVQYALVCPAEAAANLKWVLASAVRRLAFHPCGSYVVLTMMQDRALRCEFLKILAPFADELVRSEQGLRMLKAMCGRD